MRNQVNEPIVMYLLSPYLKGTWTTRVVDDESSFVHVRNDISVLSAATLRTNPGTAYRMLKDFVDLQGMAIWVVQVSKGGIRN